MKKEDIKKTILKNEEILNKYNVKSIALFGSFVRNEPHKGSNIDFLVEFQNPTFDNYMGLLNDLKKLFHKKVDIVSIRALKERIKPYILEEAEWLKKL